jgi:hypothetical protein
VLCLRIASGVVSQVARGTWAVGGVYPVLATCSGTVEGVHAREVAAAEEHQGRCG